MTHDDSAGRRVDRRTVLVATAGMATLAGCTGDSGDDAGTGDGNGPSGSTDATDGTDEGEPEETAMETDTEQASNGSTSPKECPMLPGSYATYDTGETPLPVDFDYPAAMEGSWSYLNPENWEGSNTIVGRVERGEDRDGDGDVRMAIAVKYRTNSPGQRDAWYEEAQGESLTTTDFNGESVEFLVAHPGGPYAGEHNGWQALGMLPYQPENLSTTAYYEAVVTVETLLFRADASDVTEACGKNQREAIARTVESLSLNEETTFGQYVEY